MHQQKNKHGEKTTYKKGQIVENTRALHKEYPEKFELVVTESAREVTVIEPDEDQESYEEERVHLESMTVSQLKKYAKEEGINLEGATRKDDIIDAIECALA